MTTAATAPSVPLSPGEERDPSRFRCTQCGDCCRLHRVPVTAADIVRLMEARLELEATFVEWLAPDEIDMTGEPESFVVLREGRRLPVLAFRHGACRFLDEGRRCTVYAARPASCRTFPLELESATDTPPRRLTVLQDAACPGEFDAAPDADGFCARLDARQRELEEHVLLVMDWNRRQRRRGFAGKRPETVEAFLRFAISRSPRSAVHGGEQGRGPMEPAATECGRLATGSTHRNAGNGPAER